MKIVSNTSPLIFLSHIDRLALLSSCFTKIFIPKAVVEEFGNQQLPKEIEALDVSTEGKRLVDVEYGTLHQGELEAIQLADEVNADLVLLDDLLARKKAKSRNIAVMGTLGIFLCATRQGHMTAKTAAQEIDILISEYDMYIASGLLRSVKRELKSLE
jgi:predicted nucleic acid-binding protein